MDFRLLQESALSQAADLWDYCFEKREPLFMNGISGNMP